MEQFSGAIVLLLLMLGLLSILVYLTGQLVGSKAGPFDFALKILRLGCRGIGQLFIELSKIGQGGKKK